MTDHIQETSQERDALRPDFRKRRRSHSTFSRKSIPFLFLGESIDDNIVQSGLERHLSLLDLVAIGIGGTIWVRFVCFGGSRGA
jgi:hypothetical protein